MDEDMDLGAGAWADAAAGLGKPGSKDKGAGGVSRAAGSQCCMLQSHAAHLCWTHCGCSLHDARDTPCPCFFRVSTCLLWSPIGTETGPVLLAGKLTAGTLEAVRDCIGEMMKQMPLKQCANCMASNPTIRRCEADRSWLASCGLHIGAHKHSAVCHLQHYGSRPTWTAPEDAQLWLQGGCIQGVPDAADAGADREERTAGHHPPAHHNQPLRRCQRRCAHLSCVSRITGTAAMLEPPANTLLQVALCH